MHGSTLLAPSWPAATLIQFFGSHLVSVAPITHLQTCPLYLMTIKAGLPSFRPSSLLQEFCLKFIQMPTLSSTSVVLSGAQIRLVRGAKTLR